MEKSNDIILITRTELSELQALLKCAKRNIAPITMRDYVKRADARIEKMLNKEYDNNADGLDRVALGP